LLIQPVTKKKEKQEERKLDMKGRAKDWKKEYCHKSILTQNKKREN
jgi:hypothetical protein